jgi:hypothetical protein
VIVIEHILDQRPDMQDQTNCGILSIRFASLVSVLLAANLFTLSQSIASERTAKGPPSSRSHQAEGSEAPSFSVVSPVKLPRLEETYYPITPSQRLRWFTTGTVGPAHMAEVTFVSACGTAVNRPGEYGPHWTGFADRLGVGVAGSALSNAMEASGGLILREDPRYFRVPQQPFRVRVGNVVRLTFLARSRDDGVKPAYARYAGVLGSNFLSNTWRVRSEANAQDALLRSSEGLAGRMAANAFGEFWPDLKKYFFHKRNQAAQQRVKSAE